MHNQGVGGRELEESGGAGPTRAVKGNPMSAVGSNVISQVSGGVVDGKRARARLRGCCGSESCQVVGSSPASRLMAWTGQTLIQEFQRRGHRCIPTQFSP